MTRHEKFKKNLHELLLDQFEGRTRHEDSVEFMLISIAGSLCLIADALNPEAAKTDEETKSGYIFQDELERRSGEQARKAD